jgi:AbrB family looped-hinge helix DNA binding protein
MSEIIEMGTMSTRGQLVIPNDIREGMGLKEGSKVLFVMSDDSLLIKRVTMRTFAEITRPLKEAAKKSSLKESDVDGIIHKMRKEKK